MMTPEYVMSAQVAARAWRSCVSGKMARAKNQPPPSTETSNVRKTVTAPRAARIEDSTCDTFAGSVMGCVFS